MRNVTVALMSDTVSAVEKERSYDLYLSSGLSFHWSNPNHGVTLTDGKIAWIIDDDQREAQFSRIVEVRLQTGGNAQDLIAMCKITFVDGYFLTVYNGSAMGLPDDAQAALYRDFVGDLHRRLVASKTNVDYIAGFSEGRYHIVLPASILLGLLVVALPFVLLLVTGEIKVLFLLIGGVWLFWPMYKMVQANKPHTYDPTHLPSALLL